jgi:(R)-2-hydroxyacyl-CoA dehydratese activating ATPase
MIEKNMICAGIDAGSRTIKIVLFDHAQSKVLGSGITDQGIDQPRLAGELYDRTLRDAGLARAQVQSVVATGYGRSRVPFAGTTITEITCHARGVHHLVSDARTIIEIGGQDSKVILLEDGGRVRDFAMNDRCAAGTGRFLELIADRMGVDLHRLGELSRDSRKPAIISSTCVVFAETEIIGLLAEGTPAPDIAAGVQNAIAARVTTMAGRTLAPPVCFTGGVALQAGMIRALEATLAIPIRVAPDPQFTGALGAALLAARADTDI